MKKITYIEGDATRPKGPSPKIIVHCNNAQGGWGAGFVLALSKRWAAPREAYVKAIKAGSLKLGEAQLVQVEHDIYVANVVGQNLYPSGPDQIPLVYDALEKGLEQVAKSTIAQGAVIHMPRIGAGLAGGSWQRIEEIINRVFIDKGFEVVVYDLPTNTKTIGRSLQYKK